MTVMLTDKDDDGGEGGENNKHDDDDRWQRGGGHMGIHERENNRKTTQSHITYTMKLYYIK